MGGKYEGFFEGWDDVSGTVDAEFKAFVNSYEARPDFTPPRDPRTLGDTDIEHFGASINSVCKWGVVSDLTTVNIGDFGGWAADLITVLIDFIKSGLPDDQAFRYAFDHIAGRRIETSFSEADFQADVDAYVLGRQLIADPSLLLSNLFAQYYSSPAAGRSRFTEFFNRRYAGSEAILRQTATAVFGQPDDVDLAYAALRFAIFTRKQVATTDWPPLVAPIVDAYVSIVQSYV